MQARAYVLLSRTRLAAIEQALHGALRAWQEQWGDAGLRLECAAASQDDAAAFAARAAWSDGGQAWLAWQDDFGAAIERALFGGTAAGLARTLAGRAQQALLDAIGTAVLPLARRQSGNYEPAPAVWLRGSGAVLVRVQCGRHTVQLLLDAAAVAALAPAVAVRAAPLAPCSLRGLAGKASVALPVCLGQVQLDLASLMSVRVGDVIRLDTATDQPLPVLAPGGGEPLFYGHLGRAGARLALEVGQP